MEYLDRRVELIEERAVAVLDAVEPAPSPSRSATSCFREASGSAR